MTVDAKILAQISHESFLNKSRHFISQAMGNKSDKTMFWLWASLSVELLGKSLLAKHSIFLVVDPTVVQNLYAASGLQKDVEITTIPFKTLHERLDKVIGKDYDHRTKAFAMKLSKLRNEFVHSGSNPFLALRPDEFVGEYWYLCEILLKHQGLDFDDWIKGDPDYSPRQLVMQHTAAQTERGKHKKNLKLAEFQTLEPDEVGKRIAKATHRGFLNSWRGSTSCPACGSHAGIEYDETSSSRIASAGDGDLMESYKVEYQIYMLECPICNLELSGVFELQGAGLEVDFSEIEEREAEYEQDYGND